MPSLVCPNYQLVIFNYVLQYRKDVRNSDTLYKQSIIDRLVSVADLSEVRPYFRSVPGADLHGSELLLRKAKSVPEITHRSIRY